MAEERQTNLGYQGICVEKCAAYQQCLESLNIMIALVGNLQQSS